MHLSNLLLVSLFIFTNLSRIQCGRGVKLGSNSPISSRSPYHPPTPSSRSQYHPPTPTFSRSPHRHLTPTSSRSAPYPPTFWLKKSPNKKPSPLKDFLELVLLPQTSAMSPRPPNNAPTMPAYNPQIPTSSRSAPYPPTFWQNKSARHHMKKSRNLPSPSVLADGYETFPSHPTSRYKLYKHTVPWIEALLYCQKDGEGSLLVVIESQVEAGVVQEVFARIQDNNTQFLHVGVNDIFQEGVYMVVKAGLDQPLSTTGYEVWAPGQPDNQDNGEDCAAVNRQAELCDVPCNMFGAPFLCEKPNS